MRTCTKCKEEKELSEFSKNGKYLSSYCKPCHNEYQKEYRQSDTGKEIHKRGQKKYAQSDAGKEYIKKYSQSDAGKEIQKKYQQSDACKESRKKYYQSDAGKETQKKYQQSDVRKKYLQSDNFKQSQKIYHKTDAYKEIQKKGVKKYMNTEKYFKKRLNEKGFKENEITPELIELQELSIVTYRYTQQLNQVK